MARWFLVVGLLTGTVGCWDFEGDLGRLAFSSDAVVVGAPWTPASALADGTELTVEAVAVVGVEEREEAPAVVGHARGEVEARPHPAGLVLQGWGARALTTWDGEAKDRFTVRWEPVEEVVLADPVAQIFDDRPEAEILVLEGAEVTLQPLATGRGGRELGTRPRDWSVVVDGSVSAWMEDGRLHVVSDGGAGVLALVLNGDEVGRVAVSAVAEDRVAAVTVTQVTLDETVLLRATAWTEDGARVHGVPFEWQAPHPIEADTSRSDLISVPHVEPEVTREIVVRGARVHAEWRGSID